MQAYASANSHAHHRDALDCDTVYSSTIDRRAIHCDAVHRCTLHCDAIHSNTIDRRAVHAQPDDSDAVPDADFAGSIVPPLFCWRPGLCRAPYL